MVQDLGRGEPSRVVLRERPDAELHFDTDPSNARRARVVAQGLVGEHVDERSRTDVLIVVSELVTNVIRHTGSGGVMRLWLEGEGVRIEVADAVPVLSPASTTVDQHGGRGLALVAQLSTSWGVDIHPDGKTVWAVCPSATEPGTDPRRNGR